MKTGIIYSVGLYQRGVVTRGTGRGKATKWKATRTSGGGSASSSYNPPRNCNISILL